MMAASAEPFEQKQNHFDRLPDSLAIKILAVAANLRTFTYYRGWGRIMAADDRLLPFRLVCRWFSNLVFQIQHITLQCRKKIQAGDPGVLQFLRNTEGSLKSIRLTDLRVSQKNEVQTKFLVPILALTPNLQDFSLVTRGGSNIVIQEEGSAMVQTEELLSSLSRCCKLSTIFIAGLHLNLRSISRLENITFGRLEVLELRFHDSTSMNLRLSDEGLEYLLEACPKLRHLTIEIGSAGGLQTPIIKSTSLQWLGLEGQIQMSLTVDAPSLSFLEIRGVPLASIRTGKRLDAFATNEGDFGHVHFSAPSSIRKIILRGSWEKDGLKSLLGSCRNATDLYYEARCHVKDGQSKSDLLQILSPLTSLKYLRLIGSSMLDFACDKYDGKQLQGGKLECLIILTLT
jgi:hypothetical protein